MARAFKKNGMVFCHDDNLGLFYWCHITGYWKPACIINGNFLPIAILAKPEPEHSKLYQTREFISRIREGKCVG